MYRLDLTWIKQSGQVKAKWPGQSKVARFGNVDTDQWGKDPHVNAESKCCDLVLVTIGSLIATVEKTHPGNDNPPVICPEVLLGNLSCSEPE